MKKMTKILSLVLALAMVLGMTAFAGTPTKILVSDDFSDTLVDGVASIDAFRANRTKLPAVGVYSNSVGKARQNAIDAGTPLTGMANNKFYYEHQSYAKLKMVTTADGKARLSEESGTSRGEVVWALDDPFTDTHSYADKVALVAQITWIPQRVTAAGGTAYGTGLQGVGTTSELVIAAEEGKGEAEGYDVYFPPVETEGTGKFMFKSDGADATEIPWGYQGDSVRWSIPVGSENVMHLVFRPYDLYAENKVDLKHGNLNLFSSMNREYDYGNHFSEAGHEKTYKSNGSKEDAGGKYNITRYHMDDVKAIRLPYINNIIDEYQDFVLYEVSTDPLDFTIESVTTVNAPIANAFELIMSQPVSANIGTGTAGDKDKGDNALVEKLVVNDGEEDLVYGEDYTAKLSERIVGTEVKGVITITPADKWDYSKTYTVTLPKNTYNIARIPLDKNANKVATFTTEKEPTFAMTLTASEGLTSGTAISADAMAGKTVYFEATATNESGRDINGALAIGIYDAQGSLVKYAYANKSFDDGGSNTFAASFKMEEGYTAKAFVKGTASVVAFQ